MDGTRRKKILIVEDDPDIRTMIVFILKDDYDLVVCEDGRSGIRKALEERPDLALLDIYMAGISGLDVCRELRGNPETSSIPVIMCTAGALRHEVSEGYAAGADDYIFKPFQPEDLIGRIEKLLSTASGRR